MIPIFVPVFVVLSTLINGVVITLIVRKKEQTTQKLTWLLIGTILTIGLWVIITSFQLGPLSLENNLIGFAISAAISNILIIFGIIFLSVFVSYLVRPIVSLRRIIILTSIISYSIAMYIVMILAAFDNNEDLVKQILDLADIANIILLIVFIIWSTKDIRILLAEDLNPSLRKQVKRFYYASLVGFVGNLPIFAISWFVDPSFLAFSYLLIPIALSFLVYNYLQDPRVAFLLSERTYLAIMVNGFGGLQYSMDFRRERKDKFTILISGVLNAITGIMSEFYDNPVHPQLIQFQDRQILLKWSEGYFLAVFTDRDSPLIRTAMDNTVEAIGKKYKGDLQKKIASPILLDLDDIFKTTFYFMIMDI
ncbi:MAG: hypothetical protein HeimC2_28650 [Candidatus Heimdallarchaeota archaeon LC_2]|nr:MAG: hypothetical protein HeimC2_28650 [Candidatus Heimdallarchaeota archaeon LC_2]